MTADNITLFPTHPAVRARDTLDQFVSKMRDLALTTLGVTNWSSHVWDMTGYEPSTTPGKANQRRKLLFTQLVGKENKVKAAEEDMKPFTKEFGNLVKAFAVHRHHVRPKTKDNHMLTVRAFRYLYQTLEGMKYDPVQLTNRHFMEAINLAAGREAEGSAYRVGVALGEIADTLDRKKLTGVRILFKNPISRPTCAHKNTSEAKVAREKALPSLEVIEAIGILANTELTTEEAIIIRTVEILLLTGFRINEVLELPVDCLKMSQPLVLGQVEPDVAWNIEYRPRKADVWTKKKVPDVVVPLAQRAIEELTSLCEEARKVARYHERVGYKRLHTLRKLDPDQLISGPDIDNYFGCPKGHGTGFVQRRGVQPYSTEPNAFMYRVGDIEKALLEEVRKEPLLKDSNKTIQMSQALVAVFRHQFHANKFTLRYIAEPLQLGAIQDHLQGRPTIGMPSIFDKYGLTGPNGESLSLRTHQPRHWLGTMAEEGGHLSPLEIARFFGRKNLSDNEPYDHNLNPIGDTQAFAEKLMSEHGLTKKAIQDFVDTFPLLDWEAAVAMADELGATHITDIGLCQSDYGQSPCTKHLACLRGCAQYRREKGNKEEIEKIERISKDTSRALQQAEEAVGEKFRGANNWARHHLMIIQGCGRALRIEYMNIPDGTKVQVFPNGETYATGRADT